jgi:hypothetical protein
VARQLAKDWEDKLIAQRQRPEEDERIVPAQPQPLSAAERALIVQLAPNMPALWDALTTTMAERQAMVRQMIHRVMVAGEGTSERLRITIAWIGVWTTTRMSPRPISRIEPVSGDPRWCERVRTLAQTGYSSVQMAACLAPEGFCSPNQTKPFSRTLVAE